MQIWGTTRSSLGTSHESEASEASVFCFDNASPEKSCFVDGLVCFISLCLLVFVFLNASLLTGSQQGRKKIRRASEWDAGEPVDIVFNVPFRPLVISLLHICQGDNQNCQS